MCNPTTLVIFWCISSQTVSNMYILPKNGLFFFYSSLGVWKRGRSSSSLQPGPAPPGCSAHSTAPQTWVGQCGAALSPCTSLGSQQCPGV